MFKLRNEEGFTLIELLVVIALVGVVASIAVPVISNVLQDAQTDANTASADLEANFRAEYANFIVEDQLADGSEDVNGNDGIGWVAAYNVTETGAKGDLIAKVEDK